MRSHLAVLACLVVGRPLSGQGVSSAAIAGRVRATDGRLLEGAVVEASDPATGARWRATTGGGGRYALENLPAGGPLQLLARAVGFKPERQYAVSLRLGQRLVVDLDLQPLSVQLEPLEVSARAPPELSSSRTGPAQSIPDSLVTRLPIPERDFTLLALLSPQVTLSPSGGLSFAGQPDRLNGLQIDGATNNDLRGGSSLRGSGTPGRDLGIRTLSPEAVAELQVQSAPFDVRFGNFAGGLVNAVTRSGTNALHGAFVGYYSGGKLIGKGTSTGQGQEFDNSELGFTLGGPIVRNRLAFFIDAGMQRLNLPQDVPLIGTDTTGGADSAGTGIRRESLERFQRILTGTYDVDPGTEDPYPLTNQAGNFFGKLSWQTGVNSRIELSQGWSHAAADVLTFEGAFSCRDAHIFCLSSSGFGLPITNNSTRLSWTTSGSRISNEVLLARLRTNMDCEPVNPSFVSVSAFADDGDLLAGVAGFCQGAFTDQNLLELTENLTAGFGSHRLTAGLHGELIHLPSTSLLQYFMADRWHFESLDAFEAGKADYYSSTFRNPSLASAPMADLNVRQWGIYLQDQWTPMPRLNLTLGLRVDVPSLSKGPTPNPALETALGIDNTRTPSGKPIWSPRVGFNLGLGASGSTILRGGAGVFEGRPAYKWFDAVYSHTGLEALTLECFGDEVPSFVPDPEHQPKECGGGSRQAVPFASAFDPDFRFPQSFKAALGLDTRLGHGVFATIDVLFTRALKQVFQTDVNLRRGLPAAAGEAGRPMYGTVVGAEFTLPARLSSGFGPVLEMTNVSGDQSISLSGQIRKQLGQGGLISLSYTWTSARDRFSALTDEPDADISSVPIDGTLDSRNLAPSAWNVPHKLMLVGVFDLPLGVQGSLTYTGLAGSGFTYVVDGDANADGFNNDAVYVPRSRDDIGLRVADGEGGYSPAPDSVYSKLDGYINSESCLAEMRGHLTSRNGCRNRWTNHTEGRLSRRFGLGRGHSLEAIANFFNLLSLVHQPWGEVHRVGRGGDVPLLHLVGWDDAAARGLYELVNVTHDQVDDGLSRWRVQFGLRYAF